MKSNKLSDGQNNSTPVTRIAELLPLVLEQEWQAKTAKTDPAALSSQVALVANQRGRVLKVLNILKALWNLTTIQLDEITHKMNELDAICQQLAPGENEDYTLNKDTLQAQVFMANKKIMALDNTLVQRQAEVKKQIDKAIESELTLFATALQENPENFSAEKFTAQSRHRIGSFRFQGLTLLEHAEKVSRWDVVVWLLDQGATAKADDQGNTLLHRAVLAKRGDIIGQLLDRNQDPAQTNKNGDYPFRLVTTGDFHRSGEKIGAERFSHR